MKRTESHLLDPDSLEVLAMAYRARPRTVEALAGLLDPSAAQRLEVTLRGLQAEGFVRVEGDELILESVYSAFVTLSQARIEALQADTARAVGLMEALPLLIRSWDLGEAEQDGEHPLAAQLVHGRENHWATWRRHLVDNEPARPSWVLPDLGMLRQDFPWGVAAVSGSTAALHARVLVLPSDIEDSANQELVSVATALGIDVRVLDDLPGWFYVDEDQLAGLPVNWGEGWPTSMILVRTPPVIAALNELFESLWRRGEPVNRAAAGWEPVIRLLAQGMTDEAVARFLGLDVRTVRRRVAAAMDDLGATSRFALGSAWERQRGSN